MTHLESLVSHKAPAEVHVVVEVIDHKDHSVGCCEHQPLGGEGRARVVERRGHRLCAYKANQVEELGKKMVAYSGTRPRKT